MTLIQDKGFFAMPADFKGAIVIDVYVHKADQLKFTVTDTRKKGKRFTLPVKAQDSWTRIELPLADFKGKVEAGGKIKDITIRLQLKDRNAKLDPEAQMYIRKAVLRTEK
jgi:hypothetical protein